MIVDVPPMFSTLIHLEKQNYMVSGSASSGQYLKIKASGKNTL